MQSFPVCETCGVEMPDVRWNRRFCGAKCKAKWWSQHKYESPVTHHACRVCGAEFPIGPQQRNKWLCSDECRRARAAQTVREFHARRPLSQAIYRQRTKEKLPPDSQNQRFYRLNPDAPRACESCGEDRVTEIAHKPGHERLGQRRSAENMQWPLKTWVLCPTCHRLLDRMNYPPEELGLTL